MPPMAKENGGGRAGRPRETEVMNWVIFFLKTFLGKAPVTLLMWTSVGFHLLHILSNIQVTMFCIFSRRYKFKE